ncbi:MAG TPA: type II secretion system F family protein [Woeseiaceae bacterium]
MALYQYRGRTGRGEPVAGTLEAESAAALADRLATNGITPIEIAAAKLSGRPLAGLQRRLGGGRPRLVDLIMFSRQMHTVTKAGLPLLQGIRNLAQTTANARLRQALEAVVASLQGGRDLATSLGRHPDVFSKFYVSVIGVGESSGTLPTAFARMVEYLSSEKRLLDRLKSSLRYPAIVLVAILIAIAVITTFVLPRFAPVFAVLGDDLPWATRAILAFANFASSYWYLIAAAVAAAVLGFRMYVGTVDGRYGWDRFRLRVPVLGPVILKATLARVCRSLALALESGVPMVQAVGIIARATGNEYVTARLLALREGMERGHGLSQTAQTAGLFTPLVLQMMSVGEETGELNAMLSEVAEFYEREVDYDLDNMSAALEPILIVAVGVMVTILALGVFLPLWDMAAVAGGAR